MLEKLELAKVFGDYFHIDVENADIDQVLDIASFQGSLLQAFSKTCLAVVLVNLKEQNFVLLHAVDHVKKGLEAFTNAQVSLDYVMDMLVASDSMSMPREYFNFATMSDYLREHGALQFDYVGAVTGWCRGAFLPVTYNEDGSVKDVMYIVQQIQAEKSREEKLRNQAERDLFTDLYNRGTGHKIINERLEKGEKGMFCLMDVDHFKTINDTYGHATGDVVLQAISHCLQKSFRRDDVIVRWGGDEFVVFAPGITDESLAQDNIKHLMEKVAELEIPEFQDVISISAGFVICDEKQFKNFDEAYEVADQRMYANKRQKREKSESK